MFAGTAIAARMSVTFSACSAAGVVTACQAGAEAVLERLVEDVADRRHEQHAEVAERREAEEVLTDHVALPSVGSRR